MTVDEIGFSPGVWHHPSTLSDQITLKSALEPSARVPVISWWANVVAGFLVAATSAAKGSNPNLVVTKLPMNGMESMRQLGL